MSVTIRVTVLACLALAATGARAATRQDQILIMGNPQGSQTVAAQAAATRAEFSFNDRGRGDHIVATWKLDAAGVLTEYQGSGNDYMKAAVTETFRLAGGHASWHNRAEHGDKALSGAAFYVPMNGPPELFGVLARALLKAPGHRLPLLPAGEASLETVGPLAPGGAGGSRADPVRDHRSRLRAHAGVARRAMAAPSSSRTGSRCCRRRSRRSVPQLLAAQQHAERGLVGARGARADARARARPADPRRAPVRPARPVGDARHERAGARRAHRARRARRRARGAARTPRSSMRTAAF